MHWNFLFWYQAKRTFFCPHKNTKSLLCNFYFRRHLEDLAAKDRGIMDWMKVLQGVMVAVQCFSELPFFHFAGNLSWNSIWI